MNQESDGKSVADMIVNELVGVQSMPSNIFSELTKVSESEKHLIDEGYKPVCPTMRLLWTKKGNINDRT